MLGLDAKTLSVPDYEITARLERLLTVVQPALAIPVLQLPSSTTKSTSIPQQQRPSHNRQHHQSTHSAHGRRRSPSPVSRRIEASHRARSVSPLHIGIDPRTY
jgi:hypothetical protein